jgi:hypothetical protein
LSVAKAKALEREDGRVRERGGVLEAHPERHRLERVLGRARVFGECTRAVGEKIREDLIARPKPCHLRSDGLDHARDIESEPRVPRCPQADEQPDEAGPWADTVEVRPVDRRCLDADE